MSAAGGLASLSAHPRAASSGADTRTGAAAPLLRLRGLEVNYGAVRALRGVALDVSPGTMVALLGSNGSGKSTTLKAISGTVKSVSGSIEFQGESTAGKSPNSIVQLGIAHVPEGRRIFKDLTVIENLRMGAYTRKDTEGIARDLAMVFDLFPRLKERTKQLGGSLSGGEQQMLAIGRGLLARPKLLLLDEPSLGLAPKLVADIFAVLHRINVEQGMAMLIVEQNAHVALKNTSYTYVLQVGKVACDGVSAELRRNDQIMETYMGIHAPREQLEVARMARRESSK
jgi:branched-chain amino acid transport system ATP-binding protein